MTGPGPGKIRLDCEKLVIKRLREVVTTVRPVVYIHVRGYSYARVTHIDVEYPSLENMVGLGLREIVPIYLKRVGDYVIIKSLKINTTMIIYSRDLARIMPYRYRGGGVMGGKIDGVFIGVRRDLIQILEEIAARMGWPPRRGS